MTGDPGRQRETLTEFLERTRRAPDPLDDDETRAAYCDAILAPRTEAGPVTYVNLLAEDEAGCE